MAEIEKLEMRAAEDRARLKIALEALGSSTSKCAIAAPLTGAAMGQAGRLGRGAVGAAGRNPTAAALIGLGVGLFATGTGARGSTAVKDETPKSRAPMLTAGALILGAGALAGAFLPGLGRDSHGDD